MLNTRPMVGSWRPRLMVAFLLMTFSAALAGCGGPGLYAVSGKVSYKGEPVKGGTLVFSPVGASDQGNPGKPASAEIKEDGTYSLGTNRPGDGAHQGKHRVTFTPPQHELTEEQRTDPKYKAPPPPYMGLTPQPAEVEIKASSNTIDLELVRK